ncbi:hypothetical protein SNEBB_003513 [Seison nebaliae]|nr:hypothetical protein SNEBB_003513 [Seison nebaliae]
MNPFSQHPENKVTSIILKKESVRKHRSYDHVYDPTFTLSNQKDMVRESQKQMFNSSKLVSMPVWKNMFSEGKNFPRQQYQMKAQFSVPAHMNKENIVNKLCENQTQTAVKPLDIPGRDRTNFFDIPLVANIQALPPYMPPCSPKPTVGKRKPTLFQELPWNNERKNLVDVTKDKNLINEKQIVMKTVATMTDYRDADIQTDPYSPDYMLKENREPEILSLIVLSYKKGLPAGMAEVRMIERARAKKKWEASLPAVTDGAEWEDRLRMMNEREKEEWMMREEEIDRLQEIRFRVWKKIIEDGHGKIETQQQERLEKLWENLHMKDRLKTKTIRHNHVREIRKREKKYREMIEVFKPRKRDIVEEHAQFTSSIYTPFLRSGISSRKLYPIFAWNDAFKRGDSETLEKLIEKETKVKPPKQSTEQKYTKDGFLKRKYRQAKLLDDIYTDIINQKSLIKNRKDGDLPALRYLETIQKPIPRPATPTIEASMTDEQNSLDLAVIMFQKILRGRSVQSMMVVDKEAREWIERKKQIVDRMIENNESIRSAKIFKKEKIWQDYLSMFDNKSERQQLIDEMRTTHALMRDEAAVKATEKMNAITEQNEHKKQLDREEYFDEIMQEAEGEVLGDLFDYLYKELDRLREERRIHAFSMVAERRRRMKEAEEAGNRQKENIRREHEDEIFRQVVKKHEETVDSYLFSVIGESMNQVCEKVAKEKIVEMADKINEIAEEVDQNPNVLVQEEAVHELVNTFLLPQVQKEMAKKHFKMKQSKFLKAAHDVIYDNSKDLLTDRGDERPKITSSDDEV